MTHISMRAMPANGYDAAAVAGGYLVKDVDGVHGLEEVILTQVWSPCIWPTGRRHKESWLFSECLVLDVDKPTMPLAKMMAYLEYSPWPYVVGFTKSHGIEKVSGKKVDPPCDRYRVVIPAERIENIASFEWNMRAVIERVGADASCTDGARFYWPCTKIYAVRPQGDPYIWEDAPRDVLSPAEQAQVSIETMRRYASCARLPPWIVRSLAVGENIGGRHKRCYALGASLTHYGLSPAEILRRVLASPLAEIGRDDVVRAVGNGIARALQEAEKFQSSQILQLKKERADG